MSRCVLGCNGGGGGCPVGKLDSGVLIYMLWTRLSSSRVFSPTSGILIRVLGMGGSFE